MKYGKNN